MYSTNMNNEMITAILGVILVMVAFTAIIGLILYILGSIGLMKIAKKNDVKNSWFAWIPVLKTYLSGIIALEDKIKAIIFTVVFSIGLSLSRILSLFGVENNTIGFIGLFLAFIVNFIVAYKLYKKMSKKSVAMLVFTILTGGLLKPIFLFAIRNNEINE